MGSAGLWFGWTWVKTWRRSLDLSKLVPAIKEANQLAFAKTNMAVVCFLVLFKINMLIFSLSYFLKIEDS